VTFYSG